MSAIKKTGSILNDGSPMTEFKAEAIVERFRQHIMNLKKQEFDTRPPGSSRRSAYFKYIKKTYGNTIVLRSLTTNKFINVTHLIIDPDDERRIVIMNATHFTDGREVGLQTVARLTHHFQVRLVERMGKDRQQSTVSRVEIIEALKEVYVECLKWTINIMRNNINYWNIPDSDKYLVMEQAGGFSPISFDEAPIFNSTPEVEVPIVNLVSFMPLSNLSTKNAASALIAIEKNINLNIGDIIEDKMARGQSLDGLMTEFDQAADTMQTLIDSGEFGDADEDNIATIMESFNAFRRKFHTIANQFSMANDQTFIDKMKEMSSTASFKLPCHIESAIQSAIQSTKK